MQTLAEQAVAARAGAIVFDVSDRTQIELRGADRVKFLHNFCTQDIKALPVGQGGEAFVCNAMGRVLGDIAVFAAEDGLWIETVPGVEAALLTHFDKYLIREDVELHGRTTELGELWLAGPQVPGHLSALFPGFAGDDAPLLSQQTIERGGQPMRLRRIDWLGSVGWLVSGPQEAINLLQTTLVERDVTEGSAEVLESLRIEAGFPQYGQDLTAENLSQEAARTERSISFKKGCYLGQEPVARLDALGHTNKELRRLRWEGTAVPAPGTPITDPDSDQPAGLITSAAPVHDSRPPAIAAIAMIKTKWNSPGTPVKLATDPPTIAVVLPAAV